MDNKKDKIEITTNNKSMWVNDEIFQKFEEISKQLSNEMNPINEMIRQMAETFESLITQTINSPSIQKVLETISREYDVDKDHLKECTKKLQEEGLFLPFTATPKDIINIGSNTNITDIEEAYINYHTKEGNGLRTIKILSEEDLLYEWRNPLTDIIELIEVHGIKKINHIILPFFYSLFESIIRSIYNNRGNNKSKNKMFNDIKIGVKNSEYISNDKRKYFISLINAMNKTIYENFKTHKDMSRNSVLHGYSTPIYWNDVELFKVISATSWIVYIIIVQDTEV